MTSSTKKTAKQAASAGAAATGASSDQFKKLSSSAELRSEHSDNSNSSSGKSKESSSALAKPAANLGRLKKNLSLQDAVKVGGKRHSVAQLSSTNYEELGKISEFELISCNCMEHHGKECLNQVYSLDIDYLFNCLFGFNEFHVAFSQLRKISGIYAELNLSVL